MTAREERSLGAWAAIMTDVAPQLSVLFDSFPTIKSDRLGNDINRLERQAPAAEVSPFDVAQRQDGYRIATGVISLGGPHVAVIIHEWPMPEDAAQRAIGSAPLPDKAKADLSLHRCYALCTAIGQQKPINGMIALYKVAMGLANQGAMGVASDQTWMSYPVGVLRDLVKSVDWNVLRSEGIPAELIVGLVKVQIGPTVWFLSRGHDLFGLPELAYSATGEEEYWDVRATFSNIFYYMFEHGPVVNAGDTMEIHRGATLRFRAPHADEGLYDSSSGTLVLERI